MGYYTGVFYSRSLDVDTSISVILPNDSRKHWGVEKIKEGIVPSDKPKTLILLHGLGDGHLAWFARTSILRYAEEYDVAVLMPEVARSWYQDMVYGRKYFEYITQELPEYAASTFNISTAPEDLMIAGLSMGGYGTLKCGLTYPDRYCGLGIFSSGWDAGRLVYKGIGSDSFDMTETFKDRHAMWGDAETIPDYADIPTLIKKAKIPDSLKIYTACGTEDFLYPDHLRLKQMLTDAGIPFTDTELPGEHEWAVWDRVIPLFLDYMIRGNRPAEKLRQLS